MQTQKQAGQVLSYAYGIMIAAAVVSCLILSFYLTSTAFAVQMLKSKSVAELNEIIRPLANGRRPGRGPTQERMLGAILELGEGDSDLDLRIEGIAMASNNSGSEYEAAAKIAIKKLGTVTHERLKAMLDSDDPKKVSQAIVCIKLLGEEAAEFVPQLTEMVESADDQRVRYGVFALQSMGASATPAVEALNEVLLGLDFNAQIMVCKSVVGIGRDAAPMAENLAEIYEKGNPSARSWAGIALGAIGPIENFDTAQMLGSRLSAFSHVEKLRALEALAIMGDEGASQADVIKAAMIAPSGRLRPQAAYAYYRVTSETELPVRTLVEMLSKRDYNSDALRNLQLMGADAQSAIPDVKKLLSHQNVAVRESAVLVLGSMGAAAAGEIAAIKKLSSDTDPLLRQAVEEAVAAIEKDVEAQKPE